jgi:integrase
MAGTYLKRGDSIRAQIQIDGVRKTKTFKTKLEAERWVAKQLISEPPTKKSTHTFGELCERYEEEVARNKKGYVWEKKRLRYLERHFPSLWNTLCDDFTLQTIDAWIAVRLEKVMASSVNRDLNLISYIFACGRRWKMTNAEPFKDIERPKNPEPRDRRITVDEIDAIALVLGYSETDPVINKKQRTCLAFLLAIETAMRLGEICKLQWTNVSLEKRVITIPGAITKTGITRKVPLSAEAIRWIRRLEGQNEPVMLGVAPDTAGTYFREAVIRAGIEDLHFHDSRHEATTRLAKKLHVLDLARVTGHRDIKQLQTYYNRDAEELADLL